MTLGIRIWVAVIKEPLGKLFARRARCRAAMFLPLLVSHNRKVVRRKKHALFSVCASCDTLWLRVASDQTGLILTGSCQEISKDCLCLHTTSCCWKAIVLLLQASSGLTVLFKHNFLHSYDTQIDLNIWLGKDNFRKKRKRSKQTKCTVQFVSGCVDACECRGSINTFITVTHSLVAMSMTYCSGCRLLIG